MGRGWALLAVALLATGCGPAPEPDRIFAPQEAWPNPPIIFERKTDQVEIGLAMDPAMKRYPALYDRLERKAVSQLQAFADEMTAYRRQDGSTEMAPYASGVSWAAGGETARLASFEVYESRSEGGNHPDHYVASILWDRLTQREIDRALLFRPGSDEALRVLLCRGILVEKQRRDPYFRTVSFAELQQDSCPSFMPEVPLVLAPAVWGEKAAGVLYLLRPGMAGGYASGSFRIFVPTAALRPLLADEYADQFSENPRRLPAE